MLGDPQGYVYAQLSRVAGFQIKYGDLMPTNWQALLEQVGFTPNPPEGAPLPMDAPHFGIGVSVGHGNNYRGRLFLPSETFFDEGDGNRWFYWQVDLTAHPPDTWRWIHIGGAPYSPRPCS